MSDAHDCARCGANTEPGFVLDHGHYDSRKVAQWVEGAPEPSYWSGLSLSDRRALPIETRRCTACGRLEFYARG